MPVNPTSDRALRGILLTNLVTLAIAVWQDWSVLQLLWPFWMQSLIIGGYACRRILKLRQFRTDGMKVNGRSVEPTRQTQRHAAAFFVVHFGIFHLVYLGFLVTLTTTTDAAGLLALTNESTGVASRDSVGYVHRLDFIAYVVLAAGFWLSHRSSHHEHVQADLANTPNLGTLMMLPYARVLPMHLTILIAIPLGDGVLWLFVALKIAADIGMHRMEHALLQRVVEDTGSTTDSSLNR